MANHPDFPPHPRPRPQRSRPLVRRAGSVAAALVVVVGAALLPSAPVGAAAASTKKASSRCDANAGWVLAQGRPTGLGRLAESGFYVWQERGTWRVSVTHDNRKLQKFQAILTFDAPVTGKPVGAEGTFGDVVVTGANTVSFSFSNYGGVDGVSITAPCATQVSLTGTIDANPVQPDEIFVGSLGSNPNSVPLSLARTNTTATALPAASNVAAVVTTAAPAAAPSPAAAAAVPASAGAEACDSDPWPSGVVGRPVILKNVKAASPGIYVWAEKDRQTIRLVGVAPKNAPQVFTGRITASGPITASPIGQDAKRENVKADGNTVTFAFRTAGGLDGVEISAPCVSQVVIEALANDGLVTVFLGQAATPIPALPYLITR